MRTIYDDIVLVCIVLKTCIGLDACSITIVLINGCFHNGPVISPRLVIMAQGRLYWPKAMLRANTTFRGPLCLNRGHIASPLWKTPIS